MDVAVHSDSFGEKRIELRKNDTRKWFGILEKSFLIIALLLFSGAILPHLTQQAGELVDTSQGNQVIQLTWYVLYTITFCLIVLKWKEVLAALKRDPLVVLLVIFTLCSIFWATTPELTLRRTVALVGTTMVGIYIAARYTYQEQLRMFAVVFGLAAVLSLIFAVFFPAYGIFVESRGEAWQGIYFHKNTLGRIMTLSSVAFFLLLICYKEHRWVKIGLFTLSLALLLLSNSKTALVILLVLFLLIPVLLFVRWQHTLTIPLVFIVCILASTLVLLNLNVEAMMESTAQSLERDPSLTGRTDLWAAVLDKVYERPWLGYGFGGFWQGLNGESAEVIIQVGWEMNHSHNGFLDIWTDLGVIGLLLYLLLVVSSIRKSVGIIIAHKSLEHIWPFLFFSFNIFYMLTEGSMYRQNSVFWILFVATLLSLKSREERESERVG